MHLAQSTVSKHLACLRDCGLVTTRVEGRASWYSLTDPERLRALATEAGAVMAAGDPTPPLHEHLAQAESTGEDH
jgi:DNA-binding transcriptional ArsR family regulator